MINGLIKLLKLTATGISSSRNQPNVLIIASIIDPPFRVVSLPVVPEMARRWRRIKYMYNDYLTCIVPYRLDLIYHSLTETSINELKLVGIRTIASGIIA